MSERVDGVSVLRAHRLRITAPRLAVLGALEELPAHVTVDQVATRARGRIGALSTQAVYDIMGALHRAGVVRRIAPAGSPALFETRVGDNHHHLVCRDCGKTVDVDCLTGEAPCLTAASAAGYQVDEAEITFWGRCPGCAGEHPTALSPPPEPGKDARVRES